VEQTEDDVPWADPQIQEEYELALGRFLVGFNRIEAIVSDLIVRSLLQLGRETEIAAALDQHLKRRVEDLVKLLRLAGKPTVPAPDIDALAIQRNSLAHGHFEQNPFSGEYVIIGRNREPAPEKWSPATIGEMQEKADALYSELRNVEATFFFDDLDGEG
jgi:hypothetical protein